MSEIDDDEAAYTLTEAAFTGSRHLQRNIPTS